MLERPKKASQATYIILPVPGTQLFNNFSLIAEPSLYQMCALYVYLREAYLICISVKREFGIQRLSVILFVILLSIKTRHVPSFLGANKRMVLMVSWFGYSRSFSLAQYINWFNKLAVEPNQCGIGCSSSVANPYLYHGYVLIIFR